MTRTLLSELLLFIQLIINQMAQIVIAHCDEDRSTFIKPKTQISNIRKQNCNFGSFGARKVYIATVIITVFNRVKLEKSRYILHCNDMEKYW